MSGQTPFSQIFPPPPKDYQSPWYYASLQSFWLYYLVDPDVLRSRLATLPAADELDVALFDVGQFRRGMEVELEHGRRDPLTDVTHDDPMVTGKIAWAHLKEFADYYTRLERMEEEARAASEPGRA